MQRPHPQCTGMHTRWVTVLWVAVLFGSAGLWLQGSLEGAPCAHKVSMAPAASPPPHWGVPKEPHVPCLFYSAGMESPQAPRPPQPTHPLTAAAGPGRTLGYSSLPPATPTTQEWASQRHCHRHCGTGGCLAGSSPVPTYCNTAEPILGHLLGGKPALTALQGGTPSPFSWHLALPSPSHGQTPQGQWSHLSSGICTPPALEQVMRRNPSPLPVSA